MTSNICDHCGEDAWALTPVRMDDGRKPVEMWCFDCTPLIEGCNDRPMNVLGLAVLPELTQDDKNN